MRRIQTLIFICFLAAVVSGCTGGEEKGKNKDKDVPKPAEPKE